MSTNETNSSPMTPRRQRHLMLAVAASSLATASWFLAVDWSWFIDGCPDCLYRRDVAQYRLLGWPVSERRYEHPTPLQTVAEHLGAPCSHPRLDRRQKHRWWGLCYCAAPCRNGMEGIDYSDSVAWVSARADHLRAMAAAEPNLAEEFRRRAIEVDDRTYWRAFSRRLDAETGGESRLPKDDDGPEPRSADQ